MYTLEQFNPNWWRHVCGELKRTFLTMKLVLPKEQRAKTALLLQDGWRTKAWYIRAFPAPHSRTSWWNTTLQPYTDHGFSFWKAAQGPTHPHSRVSPSVSFVLVGEFSAIHAKAQRLHPWSQLVVSRDDKTLLSSWEGTLCSSSRQQVVKASKKSKKCDQILKAC